MGPRISLYYRFWWCEAAETAQAVREEMYIQWSDLVSPVWKMKVKMSDKVISDEVEKHHCRMHYFSEG